jgi:uncharacterized protein (TIGR02646 family)
MIKQNPKTIPDGLNQSYRIGTFSLNKYLKNPDSVSAPIFSLRGGATPLYIAFHEKCVYCESKQKSVTPLYYDHFRPLSNASDLDGEISKEHYIWLMYTWDNLNLACADCIKNKSNHFPVINNRATYIKANPDNLIYPRIELNQIEKPFLIDPLYEDPEHYFKYNGGLILPKELKDKEAIKRAEQTIQILDLNRADLVKRREKELKIISDEIILFYEEEAGGKLAFHFNEIFHSPKQEFTGLKRFVLIKEIISTRAFRNLIIERNVLQNTEIQLIERNIFQESKNQSTQITESFKSEPFSYFIKETDDFKALRIEKIEINKFKGIESLKIDLTKRTSHTKFQESWLCLIGENGVGKSTVLQAVYCVLNKDDDFIQLYDFQIGGYISIKTNKGSFKIKRVDKLIRTGKKHKTPIIGFGPIRLNSSEFKLNGVAINSNNTSNLYNPLKPLIDAEDWIIETIKDKKTSKGTIKEKLLEIVGKDNRFDLVVNRDKIEIINKTFPTEKELFSQLSTGYKQLLTLASDIISRIGLDFNDIGTASGIVLIDEIENHLHPVWKTEVVEKLRLLFPFVQFIVTTHDPLCLNGLNEGEVIVLKKDDEGNLMTMNDLPSPSFMTNEQLLTSPFFGLDSSYSNEVQDDFSRLQQLKINLDNSMEDIQEMKDLENKFKIKILSGDSIRDWISGIVSNEILNEIKQQKKFDLSSIEENTREKAKKLIDKYFNI